MGLCGRMHTRTTGPRRYWRHRHGPCAHWQRPRSPRRPSVPPGRVPGAQRVRSLQPSHGRPVGEVHRRRSTTGAPESSLPTQGCAPPPPPPAPAPPPCPTPASHPPARPSSDPPQQLCTWTRGARRLVADVGGVRRTSSLSVGITASRVARPATSASPTWAAAASASGTASTACTASATARHRPGRPSRAIPPAVAGRSSHGKAAPAAMVPGPRSVHRARCL
jgi:hypothetical protein